MSFTVDKQTLEDLNLSGKYKTNSIFSLFNRTVTKGAGNLLHQMFLNPLTDAEKINERSAVFEYFRKCNLQFPFTKEQFDEVDSYIKNSSYNTRLTAYMSILRSKAISLVVAENEYDMMQRGFTETIRFLRVLNDFIKGMKDVSSSPFADKYGRMKSLLESRDISSLIGIELRDRYPFMDWLKYDYLLRGCHSDNMRWLLQLVMEIDVNIAVASVASERGFVRATAYPATNGANRIILENFAHPQVKNAITNSICIDNERNALFLTGANMAGKSTFMKSFSIALYLAHMGFPVAATKMEFTVKDGLYTSINVPDNLNSGYSHFYAEVLRVKRVAEEVKAGKNLVIIFDELFKGTNVKDAFEATVEVTKAFIEYRNCVFIVSTHIIEAGHELRKSCGNMRFVYLPTIMKGNIPTYTYKLQDGITSDRHGMMIIRNEKIIEIINANMQNRA